jgi:hypothetical protein
MRENQDLDEDGIVCPGGCGMDKNQILGAKAKTEKKENHDVHKRNDGEEHSLERGLKPEQGSNSRMHGPSQDSPSAANARTEMKNPSQGNPK